MMLNTQETEAWWLEQLFNDMTNSYKLFWFQGLFKIAIEEQRSKIYFSEIVDLMVLQAWYPVTTFKLSFGVQDQLGHLVMYVYEKYYDTHQMKQNELLCFLKSELLSRDKTYVKLKNRMFNMVPYRLLSPFFKNSLKGMLDHKKNSFIVHEALNSSESIYTIDHMDKSIYIRYKWLNYLILNQNVIKGWAQFKLLLYLQKRNPNTPNIALKLDPPGQRDLTDAKKFWKKAIKHHGGKHIYSKEIIQVNELSIDHFMPWSFVLHDELWNLCPTTKSINSQKSDGIPKLEVYFDGFCECQAFAIATMKQQKEHKLLEDYFSIGDDEWVHHLKYSSEIPIEMIQKNLRKTIVPIHQIAINQGFRLWEYSKTD